MQCVIPCAGESSRMSLVPKSLLLMNGKPLVQHIIDNWYPIVDSFIFVLRRSATYFWEYLPRGSAIVFQDEPLGLADAILQAEKFVHDRFLINLGDCVFSGTFDAWSSGIGIGVWSTSDEQEYRKSYSVEATNGVVTRVHEKPTEVPEGEMLCGMGLYLLDTRVFDYIRRTKASPSGGDFTEVLQAMIEDGIHLNPIHFHGRYVNVGSPEDIKKAEEVLQ